jgi:hypothetical protein
VFSSGLIQDYVQMNQGPIAVESTADPAVSPTGARARSKALFGNSDRIAIAAAVARSPDGWVNATDLHLSMPSIAVNRIRAQLVAFVDAGLVDNAPRTQGDRRVWYVRRAHEFWVVCQDLEAAWTADRRPGVGALG